MRGSQIKYRSVVAHPRVQIEWLKIATSKDKFLFGEIVQYTLGILLIYTDIQSGLVIDNEKWYLAETRERKRKGYIYADRCRSQQETLEAIEELGEDPSSKHRERNDPGV